MCFFTFSYPSHLKPMVLECFLDNDLPTTVSKGMILLRRSLTKSKKHQAIARAVRGGCGDAIAQNFLKFAWFLTKQDLGVENERGALVVQESVGDGSKIVV